jgi:enoyl-CoA hydratase/carnithine racemase
VLVTVTGRVGVLTLDRPPVNALASSTYRALRSALSQLAATAEVSVVVLRSSSERAFCAGADIGELGQLSGEAAAAADAARQELARETFSQLLHLPQPTIAVVDGPAIGAGAVVASCCDIRLASSRASFQLPEVAVGRCGGARHLMRHLPQSVVRRMYFSGDRVSAADAAAYGFVELVDADGSAFEQALALAGRIARHSPLALRLGKEALNSAEPLPVSEGYALEQQYTLRLARSADAQEALAARREKREPRFTGT